MARHSANIPPSTEEKTSILVEKVLARISGDEVSLGYLMFQLRRRSFGGLFILFAALGMIPGISLVAGLIMLVPAVQLAMGFRAPLLPRFLRQRQISVVRLKGLGNRAISWIEKIERYAKPRWPALTRPPITNLVGFIVIGLALVVTLPLPLSNLPPAIALLFLAFGILERDGLMVCIGLITGIVALAIGVLIAYAAVEGILYMLF